MADADEPQPDDPSWLKFAFQELALHVVEKPGKKTNERIERYLQSTRGSPGREQDETLWCSAFVNFCIEESTGLEGTNNLAARSWLNWEKGKEATRPTRGCIVVFSRPSAGEHSGHVGFYLSGSAETGIRILGGNQSDAVSIVRSDRPGVVSLCSRGPRQESTLGMSGSIFRARRKQGSGFSGAIRATRFRSSDRTDQGLYRCVLAALGRRALWACRVLSFGLGGNRDQDSRGQSERRGFDRHPTASLPWVQSTDRGAEHRGR